MISKTSILISALVCVQLASVVRGALHEPSEVDKELGQTHKIEATDAREKRIAFNIYDENNDGNITANELKSTLATLGKPVVDDTHVAALFAKIDVDNSVTININEFFIAAIADGTGELQLRALFNTIDTNGNGQISVSELEKWFTTISKPKSASEIKSMIQAVNTDDNPNEASYYEFLVILLKVLRNRTP